MLSREQRPGQAGFTLVELLIAIVLTALVGTMFLIIFKSNIITYFNLQTDATAQTQLAAQSARVATVLRGATDVTSASANDLVIYSYFYPSDAYVSQVHYYVQTSGGVKTLVAAVTPMTANPPTGTLETDQQKTYTIIDNFYQPSGGNLFTYFGAGDTQLGLPIDNLQGIKGIQVNLAAQTAEHGQESTSVQVSLRNRKTNL